MARAFQSKAKATGRDGILIALKRLLISMWGVSEADIAEDMKEYEQLSNEELDATVIRLRTLLSPAPNPSRDQHPRDAHSDQELPLPQQKLRMLSKLQNRMVPCASSEEAPNDLCHESQNAPITERALVSQANMAQENTLFSVDGFCLENQIDPSTTGEALAALTSTHQGVLAHKNTICSGRRGVVCEIDAKGQIVPTTGGGPEFLKCMHKLVDLYFPRIHLAWPKQDTDQKRRFIAELEDEFGTGWSHKKVLQDASCYMRHRRDHARS